MTLADRLAIEDLLAAYTRFGDSGRLADMAALFAPAGELEVAGVAHRGPEAIEAFLRSTAERFTALTHLLPGGHHVSSRWIEVEGDVARSGSRFLFVALHGPDHWGTYRDELGRLDGTWRITRRRVRTDGFAPGSRLGPG